MSKENSYYENHKFQLKNITRKDLMRENIFIASFFLLCSLVSFSAEYTPEQCKEFASKDCSSITNAQEKLTCLNDLNAKLDTCTGILSGATSTKENDLKVSINNKANVKTKAQISTLANKNVKLTALKETIAKHMEKIIAVTKDYKSFYLYFSSEVKTSEARTATAIDSNAGKANLLVKEINENTVKDLLHVKTELMDLRYSEYQICQNVIGQANQLLYRIGKDYDAFNKDITPFKADIDADSYNKLFSTFGIVKDSTTSMKSYAASRLAANQKTIDDLSEKIDLQVEQVITLRVNAASEKLRASAAHAKSSLDFAKKIQSFISPAFAMAPNSGVSEMQFFSAKVKAIRAYQDSDRTCQREKIASWMVTGCALSKRYRENATELLEQALPDSIRFNTIYIQSSFPSVEDKVLKQITDELDKGNIDKAAELNDALLMRLK